MTEHMLLRIASRPKGWLGEVSSDPANNVTCEKFAKPMASQGLAAIQSSCCRRTN